MSTIGNYPKVFISILLQNYKINSPRSKLYTFYTFLFISSHNYLRLKLGSSFAREAKWTETRKWKKKKKEFFQRRPNNNNNNNFNPSSFFSTSLHNYYSRNQATRSSYTWKRNRDQWPRLFTRNHPRPRMKERTWKR